MGLHPPYASINRIRFKGFTTQVSQAGFIADSGHPQVCIASIGRLHLVANKIDDQAPPAAWREADVVHDQRD